MASQPIGPDTPRMVPLRWYQVASLGVVTFAGLALSASVYVFSDLKDSSERNTVELQEQIRSLGKSVTALNVSVQVLTEKLKGLDGLEAEFRKHVQSDGHGVMVERVGRLESRIKTIEDKLK